ncbi:hypothetical protein GGS21DRAFT_118700 [Xylaria nigripes]|nr:hypothetical protein GGS21DRAFT_118700 [Xylaria nigripes]
MFELPETKRVRRKDLFDSASSSSSDAESDQAEAGHDAEAESVLREKLNAQLSGLLDFSFTAPPPEQQPSHAETGAAQQEAEHQEEETFAFRLFRDQAPTHTVVLTQDDDPAALGEGGFVVPSRPRSYYIASAPSPTQMSEYRGVTVSAEYILADAKKRRWGLEKPWRVIHITADSNMVPKPTSGSAQDGSSAGSEKKRKRPGKKHRILLRVRAKAAQEHEEVTKKIAMEKEQHIQEKKKRLNRERKLKRRQKEREKKAQARTGQSDGNKTDDDSQEESDS